MKITRNLILMGVILALSGCLTRYDPIVMPVYKRPVTVYVSDQAMGGWNAPNGLRYKNSQLYFSAKGRLIIVPGGMYSSADIDMIEEDIDAISTLTFERIIAKQIVDSKREYSVVIEPESSDISMFPNAVLNNVEEGKATFSFRLIIRYKDRENEIEKSFLFHDDEPLPLTGKNSWIENDAKRLMEKVELATRMLVDAFIEDFENDVINRSQYKPDVFIWQQPNLSIIMRSNVLKDYGDYVLVNILAGEKIFRGCAFVVSKSLLHR